MVDAEEVQKLISGLSEKQREALLHRQLASFVPDAVFARGAVTGALRRRGIIKGAMPHARLTEVGEAVCSSLEQKSA